jgi:hypothetical protein
LQEDVMEVCKLKAQRQARVEYLRALFELDAAYRKLDDQGDAEPGDFAGRREQSRDQCVRFKKAARAVLDILLADAAGMPGEG